MKITLRSTNETRNLNGHPCRVWVGETALGVPCEALIPVIAFDATRPPLDEEIGELVEIGNPGIANFPIPLRRPA